MYVHSECDIFVTCLDVAPNIHIFFLLYIMYAIQILSKKKCMLFRFINNKIIKNVCCLGKLRTLGRLFFWASSQVQFIKKVQLLLLTYCFFFFCKSLIQEPFNAEPSRSALISSSYVTPVDLFYKRNHGPVPIVDDIERFNVSTFKPSRCQNSNKISLTSTTCLLHIYIRYRVSICGLVEKSMELSIADMK